MNFSKILVFKTIDNLKITNNIFGVGTIKSDNKIISISLEIYNKNISNYQLFIIDDLSNCSIKTIENKYKQTIFLDDNLNYLSSTFIIFSMQDSIELKAITELKKRLLSFDLITEKILNLISENKENYIYDDDQIASENYYLYEENQSRILNKIKPTKNQSQEETYEKEKDFTTSFNEETSSSFENVTYYEKSKIKILNTINNNEKHGFLSTIFKNSHFVKAYNDSQNSYIFGLIYTDETKTCCKYVCYAIEGEYNNTPTSFRGISSFIPLKQYEPYSKGFYVIFQDAITGKTIRN